MVVGNDKYNRIKRGLCSIIVMWAFADASTKIIATSPFFMFIIETGALFRIFVKFEIEFIIYIV